jgi:hypothetical protein
MYFVELGAALFGQRGYLGCEFFIVEHARSLPCLSFDVRRSVRGVGWAE